jgi:plastocyanin/uncharacterized membrane protein YozB (DUF420 family)
MFKQVGFLGTGATFGADLTLIVQIIFFIALCIGVVAQIRRRYQWHDRIQAPVVVLNLFFIIFIMAVSFFEARVLQTLPRRPGDPYYLTVALHGVLGTLTQGLALYCLLAGFKILPRKIGRLKYVMRATFVLWAVTLAFGLATYYVWYVRTPTAVTLTDSEDLAETNEPVEPGAPPPPRRVSLQNFVFQPAELTVALNTKVIWVNQDGAPHNVTFDDESVASDNFFQGEAFEHTFRALGTFPIYCTLHGNPGNGMAAVVRVVSPNEENLADIQAQPTPDLVPPAPTPAPPVPPAPVALIEPPAPSDTVVGVVAFRDNTAPGDTAVLALNNLAPASAGAELQAWLISSDNRILNIGPITPDAGGALLHTYTDPTQQNLMATYDGFQITEEPAFDDDPTPGTVLYSGRQPGEATSHILAITVRAEDTPGNAGYAVGARVQTEELIRHVEYIQLAFELGSIADAQRHAEHVVNILEGEGGEFFGDVDHAHGVQNPGDGFGVMAYIRATAAAAERAANARDATNAIRIHADHVMYATDNAENWATLVRDAALQVTQMRNIGDIGPQLETLNRYSGLLLTGEDTDGNGEVDPMEGGIFTAYQHAQYMGAIGVIAGASLAVVDAEPILELGVAQQAAAGEVTIEMADFQFAPGAITIPPGTTVRFINVGQAKHSATADNDRFNTGLLDNGQTYTVAFPDAGAYAYYCLLHGAPGGGGMAGTVTVEP